jgi:hypothetical protein
MRLDIHNIHKLIDSEYHRGRFICTNAVETLTNYRFQFNDTHSLSARYVWVEVSRFGQWDTDKWIYRLNYPNAVNHSVTAKWLSVQGNAYKLMEDCLNYSL